MTEYTIVTGESAEGLSEKVNEMISEGWKAQGGVLGDTQNCMQAMVKTAKNTDSLSAMVSKLIAKNEALKPGHKIIVKVKDEDCDCC